MRSTDRSMPILLFMACFLLLPGCSYKAWYEGLQQRQRQECYERGSQADVNSCLEKANLGYDSYRHNREQVINR